MTKIAAETLRDVDIEIHDDDMKFRTAGDGDGTLTLTIGGETLEFCANDEEEGGACYSAYYNGELLFGSYAETVEELATAARAFFAESRDMLAAK